MIRENREVRVTNREFRIGNPILNPLEAVRCEASANLGGTT